MNINEIMSKYFSDLSNPIDINKYGNDILKIFNNNGKDNDNIISGYNKFENDRNDEILNLIFGIDSYEEYKKEYKKEEDFMNKMKLMNILRYYEISIQKGNTDAMIKLAEVMRDHRRYDEMKKYYLMAIEKGNTNAIIKLGKYYLNIQNYEQMEKYYLMAINKGNTETIIELADYYKKINFYTNMIKYYLMAIDRGNIDAMNNLADYYQSIKEYEEMKKYYLMAIDKGNINAMCGLGSYYQSIQDYEEMEKYYLTAIDKGSTNDSAMVELGLYYQYKKKDYGNLKNIYIQMKKYYLMAIDKGNTTAMYQLGLYYKNEDKSKMEHYYSMIINKSNKFTDKNKLKEIITDLAEYYESINNYEQMKKCYLML